MPNWKYLLFFRAPLVTTVGLILVVGFLTTNIISYQVSKSSLREALVGNELRLTSNNIYSEIQRDLLRPVFVASLMSNNTFVKDWILKGEQDVASMTRYLTNIRDEYGVFTSFMVSDKTLNYYHFSGVQQVVSKESIQDSWYFRLREMKQAHEINVEQNQEQDNTQTIFIDHKIFDYNDKFLGAIGVGLEFQALAKIVNRYKDHFGRHIYFVDEAGKIMVRSHGNTITENDIYTAPGMSTIAKDLMATDKGFFEYSRAGETMLVNSRSIPDLKWRVVVEQRESDALAGIRQSLITNLIVGFVVIALTLVIVMYTVNLYQARLKKMATTDKLTNIGNRSMFDLVLGKALKRHLRDGKSISLILIDVDYFKLVNDALGHLEGDRALVEIAKLLRTIVRETDELCRWGGEEFAVLAYNCGLDSAAVLAENLRLAVEQASIVTLPDKSLLTISLGITEVCDGDDCDTVLARADKALFKAKKSGRNCVRSI